jgi:hypothetical protein
MPIDVTSPIAEAPDDETVAERARVVRCRG